MGKNKTKKIAETKLMPNILDFPREFKGRWHEYFDNHNPIVLELACGKGHYTVGLAEKYPDKNFIGIDVKGPRLWTGGKIALEKNLKNAAFARIIIENITEFFAENEVAEIWITFPDPQPKNARRRLTHPRFLADYRQILQPTGLVHLKTDNTMFFEFTIGVLAGAEIQEIERTRNLYFSPLYENPVLRIETYYEALWVEKGAKIKYVQFKLS